MMLRNKWSVEEEEKLKKLYPYRINTELLEIFGRSRRAILEKASRLRLRKSLFFFKGRLWEVKEMSETEKAWLACAIDGEGSIYSAQTKRQRGASIRIQVNNCNEKFIEKCKEITGVGFITRTEREGRRPIFRWCCQSNPLSLQILEQIKDFLIIKCKLAELGIQYIKSRLAHYNVSKTGFRVSLSDEELRIIEEMKFLKPKGKKL